MFAQGEGKEIVFIDEPTSHLDHKMVESLLPELKEFLEVFVLFFFVGIANQKFEFLMSTLTKIFLCMY